MLPLQECQERNQNRCFEVARAMKEEGGELDSFDTVITYLIDEELASTFEEQMIDDQIIAETISRFTSCDQEE